MKNLTTYGPWALIAGASEGLGAAYARALAKAGFHLILVARRQEKLRELKQEILASANLEIDLLPMDLSQAGAAELIMEHVAHRDVGLMIYNAAFSPIGPFLEISMEQHQEMLAVNVRQPMALCHYLGQQMKARKRSGIILMSSLAGYQGSSLIAHYAATKAYGRMLGLSLWREFQAKGIDVLTCCAGATATPNYLNSKPKNISKLAPPVLPPEQVVGEALRALGKKPLLIPGKWNRLAHQVMDKLFSEKKATEVMSENTERMYQG